MTLSSTGVESVDVRWWFVLWFSGQENTKTDIAHRLALTRSQRGDQPSATHPHFWQTCLFTIFPIISTTNRGSQFYGPQTKILDGWTKRCVCVFEWVFKSVLAQNEYSHPWKVFKKAHATLCSVFQNLRLGSIKLLWKYVSECLLRPSKIFVWVGDQKRRLQKNIACYYLLYHLAALLM